MEDLIYLLVTVAFFGLMGGLVVGCEKIIGPDDASGTADASATDEVVAR